jgi:hypothetical protein
VAADEETAMRETQQPRNNAWRAPSIGATTAAIATETAMKIILRLPCIFSGCCEGGVGEIIESDVSWTKANVRKIKRKSEHLLRDQDVSTLLLYY